MASAYELLLVLRGRNYLSNDLRKASADISGLSRKNALTSLSNQKKAIEIRQKQITQARKLAEAEQASIRTGPRRVAMNQALAAHATTQANALQQVRRAETQVADAEKARLQNAQKISRLQRTSGAAGGAGGYTQYEQKQLLKAAKMQDQILAERAATARRQVEIAGQAYGNTAIQAQKLVEGEAALSVRDAQLTEIIHTKNDAYALEKDRLEQVNAATLKAQSRVGQFAKVSESAGRTMQTFGLVTTAAFAGAAYAASKFSTSVSLAATQSTLPGNNSVAQVQRNATFLTGQLQRQLVTGSTPAKSSDLTGGLYTIYSGLSLKGGQKAQLKEGLSILKEFSRVFTANYGQVSFNDVTKTGIALINNFGLSAKQIPTVMNQMQASVRFGAMTMGEMTSSLNQVIPAFKSAGYSTKQMFQDIAFVSRVFPSLRIGTTGLARLTETFGKYRAAISKDVGTDIAPGGKLSPVSRIVQEIVKAHPALKAGGVALQNYFKQVTGSSQFVNARRVFSAYVTQLGLYRDVAGKVGKDNNEVAKSFRVMSQTPQVRWAELTNQLRGLVLEIGTAALPVFQKMAGPIKAMVNWFDHLSPSTKKLVGEIGAGTGVFLLFGGTLLVVVGMIARFVTNIKTIGTALGILKGEAGLISARFALGLGLLVLIPIMIKYHKQVGAIIKAMGGLKPILEALTAAWLTYKLYTMAAGTASVVAAGEIDIATAATLGLNAAMLASPPLIAAAIAALLVWQATSKKGFVHRAIFDSTANAPGLPVWNNKAGIDGKGAWVVPGTKTPVADQAYWNKEHRKALGGLKPLQGDTAYQYDLKGRTGFNQADEAHAKQLAGLARAARTADPKSAVYHGFDVNKAIQNLERLRALTLKPNATLEQFKKYEAARAALEKHFKGTALTALDDYLNEIESRTKKSVKKQADAAKKAAAQLKTELLSIAQNAMSMYDTLLSQNQGIMGSLFSGPFLSSPRMQNQAQYGYQPRGGDYLRDIRSQNQQFRTFYKEIGKLQKRGAPAALITQLIQAGPQALPAIRALAGMGKGQWKQYTAAFNEGQKLLHKQTIAQLKSQLKDYRKYGTKIAEQIISGMRDGRLGLANEIKSIIKGMFGVTVPNVHHPSKTAQNHARRAAQNHAARHSHSYNPHTTNTHPVTGTSTRTTQGVEHHTHYHVTAPASDHTSVKAQLRHAEFARKTKYGVTP